MPEEAHCTLCDTRCPLSAPKCNRGLSYVPHEGAQQAEAHEATRGPVGTGGGFRGSAAAYLASGPRV